LKRLIHFAIRVFGAAALTGAATAGSAPTYDAYSRFADPQNAVVAIAAGFKAPEGGVVRVAIFENDATFLETPHARFVGSFDEYGVAVIALADITPGDYAFVAYYDANSDGRLNRSAIGKPKEPVAFSNNIRPKMRRPRFEEAKVSVAPGAVIVLALEE